MKVRTRLSLYCSIVFGVIFAIISLLIYGLYYKNTEKTIYRSLEKIGYVAALFYLEEDELNSREFEKVKLQFEELVTESSYQIYDIENHISYGDSSIRIPVAILDDIRKNGKLSFTTDNFICYGIFYEDNQGDFVIVSKDSREELDGQLNSLLWILVVSFFIGLVCIIVLSRWVSSIAYRPFTDVIAQVKNISTNNPDMRIESPDTKDELQNLTDTFNELLGKISDTFLIQKNFVRYISHEFKTPLASILGNLEVFSLKKRNPEEYGQLAEKLIKQINQLEETLNTLIVVSDLSNRADITSNSRIDELVWEIIQRVKDCYANARISVTLNIDAERQELLLVTKDRPQLFMALYNLIENAVKYSQGETVNIEIKENNGRLIVAIKDRGIGIPDGQLEHISKPFYRADNTNKIQGSGIGLSIALRILEKNNVEYQIQSEENTGTEIILFF